MTDEMMTLRALVEKAPEADILREMIGFAAQRLMEMEVGGVTGAARLPAAASQDGASMTKSSKPTLGSSRTLTKAMRYSSSDSAAAHIRRGACPD